MKFTVSSLNTLSSCGEQFRQRHILKIQVAPNYNMILGRAVDAAINADLRNKIATGKLLQSFEVSTIAQDEVEDVFLCEGISLTEEQAKRGMNRLRAELKQEAVRMAQMHHSIVAPWLEPTHVQREFEIEVAGHTVTGRIDVQEGSRSIRDTKVTGRAPASDEADRSLQLTIYAMAIAKLDGRLPETLHLDYLVHSSEPRVVKLKTSRSFYQFHAVEERILAAVKSVESESFVPANRDSWMCDERFCSYFNGCRYV